MYAGSNDMVVVLSNNPISSGHPFLLICSLTCALYALVGGIAILGGLNIAPPGSALVVLVVKHRWLYVSLPLLRLGELNLWVLLGRV